jgi:beta-glucanase (GH16 family)
MRLHRLLLAACLLAFAHSAQAQQCAGGAISTHEAYQYGRFETRMQSAQGNGIVSSFFLYNADLGCNWPAENNEIDVEMTGNRDNSVQFTTHYPGPWSSTQIIPTGFNPHDGMHDYAFEWEPGVVRWFVDGELVYTQSASYVNGLMYPMRIMMNLWAADAPSWVGEFDPTVLPVQSSYEYVRYYAYTPGTGDAGSNGNFTLEWTDNLDSLDPARWETSEFGGFAGNFCEFVSSNVNTSAGQLEFLLTDKPDVTYSPVHFSVDASGLNLSPSDRIYVNGEFNGWCGLCNPMSDSDGDGVWELTLSLPAGKHEYVYSKNGWQEVGGAPMGSSCDFSPCDAFANYGVAVPYSAALVDTDTYRWASCDVYVATDTDNDGTPDNIDNCINHPNGATVPDGGGHVQLDTDGDGYGNACDADFDGNGLVNFADLAAFKASFGTSNPNADFDGSGLVNFADLARLKSLFGKPPGPSGTVQN